MNSLTNTGIQNDNSTEDKHVHFVSRDLVVVPQRSPAEPMAGHIRLSGRPGSIPCGLVNELLITWVKNN